MTPIDDHAAGERAAETLRYDLVVIGGGLAGLCAAIAAARTGARTALVQERPVFGGNCSSEVRVVPHGACHSNAWAAETGLVLEMLLDDRATNHESFPDHGMINANFDFALLQAAHREPNLDFFLNTVVSRVESRATCDGAATGPTATSNGLGRIGGEHRSIDAVVATQMGSEKRLRFEARQFVDATGDGTVGYLAGADFRYGREARDEFGENLAPLIADDVTMGATITMRARDVGRPVAYEPPPWIERYERQEDIGFKRTIYHIEKPIYGGYWWLEVCNPFHQIDDNPAVRHELHRHVLGVWNFIKNHAPFRDRAANYALDWIGMIPGKRESRRLMGDVLLTEHDCHEDRRWPDAVGAAGWWIDLHIKGGILNKKDPGERENADRNYKHWIRVSPFTLPLRAFYSRNVQNLWLAGRCLSTTHVALGPVRVMQTLAQLGQSVGIAAGYAVRKGLPPRTAADPAGPHMAGLRQAMLREDVRIPGVANEDAGDLARLATVTASSAAALRCDEPDEAEAFRMGADRNDGVNRSPALAAVLPITERRLNRVSLHLRSDHPADQTLRLTVQPLHRLWDRPDDQPVVAEASFVLPAGSAGWIDVPLDATLEPGRPYRIAIAGGEDVRWSANRSWPVGTVAQYLHVSPGGCEPKNAHLDGYAPHEVLIPAYRHWRQLRGALAIRTAPEQRPFEGANAVNGFAWPDSMPNIWMSDPGEPLPQHLELAFAQPMVVGCVMLSFDTNLSRPNQSAPPFFRAPEAVRDWRLLARVGGEWVEVHREEGNHQRRRTAVFEPVAADALRVEALATNGVAEARIFEVRAYAADPGHAIDIGSIGT
ncbi:FAD-dependent oxidoreductase [Sphingomonas lenta]|uniref:FAD-dependent oxidoreductase n=1 Tax=Sphingomonas lenta TaxID=1141887 RepID=A0A2A2SIK5_9SPHN|nr:FAD-dependent oxidoreductase [Sphingomonas lenta]PAX09072.1 hypothetical protein CKY28_07030 [Sphingomonas lenta]